MQFTVPGEPLVCVRQVEPGNRLKGAITLHPDMLPWLDDEAIAHAMFDVASGAKDDLPTLIERYAKMQCVQ